MSELLENDFSGGIWQDAGGGRNTVADAREALVKGTEIVRRGGAVRYLPDPVGETITGVTSAWTHGGERTVLQTLDGRLLLLSADGQSVATLTTGVIPHSRVIGSGGTIAARKSDGTIFCYSGSRLINQAEFSVSMTVTAGSPRYTASGQSFGSTVDPGMFVAPFTSQWPNASSVAVAVESNDVIVGTSPSPVTLSGVTFYIYPHFDAYVPVGSTPGLEGTIDALASAGQRFLAFRGNRMWASAPDTARFDPTEYIDLPVSKVIGAQGFGSPAAAGFEEGVLIFTTAGVFLVTNLAYDLTDQAGNPQWRLRPVSQEVVLWDDAGLAGFGPAMIAPCRDNVYALTSDGQVRVIGDGIRERYTSYVNAGCRPGQAAVYRGHYILPILSSANQVVDVFVCRLNGFVWTRWSLPVTSVAAHQSATGTAGSALLGGVGPWLADLDPCFNTDTASADFDGVPRPWSVITRDLETGRQNTNTVLRFGLLAEHTPPVRFGYSKGSDGSPMEALSPPAPPSDGSKETFWRRAARTRRIRLAVESTDDGPVRLRSLAMTVRDADRRT